MHYDGTVGYNGREVEHCGVTLGHCEDMVGDCDEMMGIVMEQCNIAKGQWSAVMGQVPLCETGIYWDGSWNHHDEAVRHCGWSLENCD